MNYGYQIVYRYLIMYKCGRQWNSPKKKNVEGNGVMGIRVIKESDRSLESVVSKHIIEANLSRMFWGLFGPFAFFKKVPLKMNI